MGRTALIIKNGVDEQSRQEALAQASWLLFDATVNQVFIDRAAVTEHPIETGSTITDHVNILPETLSLTAVVSDKAFVSTDDIANLIGGVALSSFFTSGQFLESTFSAVTAAGAATQVAGSLNAGGRANKAYELIKQATRTGKPVDIITPVRTYTDMVIDSLQVNRDSGTGAIFQFDLGFKKLVIVDTEKLATKPDNDSRRGRKKRGRQRTKAAKGNTATKPLVTADDLAGQFLQIFTG